MSEPKSTSLFGSHGASNGCVMVVEDEPIARDEMRVALEKTGYDVIEVEDGKKAVEAIKWGENPLAVDVIITDVDAPSGMEAVDYFKNQYPSIQLIGLTGLPSPNEESIEPTKIVIVGAGKGGSALLGLFSNLPGVEIIGITDKDAQAPALTRARELGIPVMDDPVRLISSEGANLIVNVTGNPAVEHLIAEHKKPSAEVLGGEASKLLWNVVQHEAQMQGHVFQTEKLAKMVEGGTFINYLVKPVRAENLTQSVAKGMELRELNRL